LLSNHSLWSVCYGYAVANVGFNPHIFINAIMQKIKQLF
jgi:hypothetical protein